jgi:exonuclease III
VLESLLRKADVICLQETHGDLASLRHRFSGRWANWNWHHSPGITRGEAGCSIGFCKTAFQPQVNVTFDELVRGRVLVANFPTIRIVNIHRHDFTQAQNNITCKLLKESASLAQNPETPHTTIACGDWNFNLSGGPPLRLNDPTIIELPPLGAPPSGAPAQWTEALKELTCVITAEPTHFSAESRTLKI